MIPRYSVDFSVRDAQAALSQIAKRLLGRHVRIESEDDWLISNNHHVVFTWSGRVALRLILRAINLHHGESVVVPLWTCSQVHRSILAEGGNPYFVGLPPGHLMPPVESYIEAIRRSKARILVVISYWGYPVDLSGLRQNLPDHVVLIQDCALSWGSSVRGVPDGYNADFAFFSFGIGKPLCLGGGGALIYHPEKWPQLPTELLQAQLSSPPSQALVKAWAQTVVKSLVFSRSKIYKLLRDMSNEDIEDNVALPDPSMWQAPCWMHSLGVLKSPEFKLRVSERRKKWNLLSECMKEVEGQTITEEQGIDWNTWMVPILLPPSIDADNVVNVLKVHGFETRRAYADALRFVRGDVGDHTVPNWIIVPSLDYMTETDIYTFTKLIASIEARAL